MPRRALINVVFPAPLGPNNPVIPFGILQVKPSRARNEP